MDVIKLAVILAAFSISACGGGGGGVMSTSSFTVANVETVASIKNNDSIIKYDISQSGETLQGYVITNEPDTWQNGVFQQVSLDDVQIAGTLTYAPRNVYVGYVTYNGIDYKGLIYVDPDNDKLELILAQPSDTVRGGWGFGEDYSLPNNTIIRALGQAPSNVILVGTAQYRGAIMVQGGDGVMVGEAVMDVDFDASTATFSARAPSSPDIYASVTINNADGSFTSDNLIVTFNASIFDPQQTKGNLKGNFTGENQNGAIGAIWSDADQTQFQGAFALDKM